MNFYLGLTRLSAVIWGFFSILIFLGVLVVSLDRSDRNIWHILVAVILGLVLSAAFYKITHGITRWILSGFFNPSAK
jgi:cell division protein FtsW (lipid II flippase)